MHDQNDEIDPPAKKAKVTQKNSKSLDKISDILNGLGISTDVKAIIIGMAKGDLAGVSTYLKGMKILGNLVGVGSVAVAGIQYLKSPTTANLLNFLGNTGSLALGPIGGFAAGFSDSIGLSGFVYGKLGSLIDNIAGYSIGNQLQLSFSKIIKK